MLSIRYKKETIDIQPGQQLEITRNNPMFLIDNVLAEYSDPFSITYSNKNVRNLGDYFFDLATKKKGKFDVEVLDGNSFAFNATQVIETAKIDRRASGKGNASGYLLTGLSNFLNRIKDVKANTLKLGGERTFPYTTNDPADGSNGYVQHFQKTWDNTYDYITAPIRNELWTGEEDDENSNGWMNIVDDNGNLMALQAYVLQLRVKYILKELFSENGWILDTTAMDGTGWENIFLFSVKPLFSVDVTWSQELVGDQYVNTPTAIFKDLLTFNLADWLSPEVTCSQLLMEICKKYGWVPLCSNDRNVCRLVPLRSVKSGRVLDWTKYASAKVEADFSGDARVVAFTNDMPANDQFPSKPNFENLTIGSPVLNKAALPSPLGNLDNTVIYSYAENQWFKIDLDETNNQRIWVVFADGIYDKDVDGATETYDTKVSTLPVYRTKYRTSGGIDYYGLFPYCEQSRNKEWGLRTLVYHGMVDEVKADGTHGPKKYPYLSSIRVLPDGTEGMEWSNVLEHIKEGGDDFGIIEYWFRNWLDFTGLLETDVQLIYVPLHELYNFRFDDIINLFNIPYLIKSYVEPRPYMGFIQATLQKLTLKASDAEGAPPAGVYLKMVRENEVFTPFIDAGLGMSYTDVTEADWIIYIFADAAGTIPALPSVDLTINVEGRTKNDDNPDPVITSGGYHMNTSGEIIILGTPYVFHTMKDAVLNIPFNPPSHFTREFRLLPGTGYQVIP